jgi:hypothetical protein
MEAMNFGGKDDMTESGTTLKPIEFNENIVAFLGFAILLVSAVVWADKAPTMEKTDFSVTYIGSRMVYFGMGTKLYDLDEQQKLKSSLLKDAGPLIYEHPPFEALLLAPLGALPYKTAYLVWGLVNVVIWLTLPLLMRPYAPVPRDDLGYTVMWFLFAPLGIALFQGQSSIVLLLLFALTLIQLKRGNEQIAGLCLGVGLFKFQFVLPFALIFLLRRKWRFIGGFALSGAVLGILSLIAVGWTGILSYLKLLAAVSSHPANVSYGSATDMATLQGFVYVLLKNSANAMAVRVAVAAISLLLIALTAWYWNRTDRDNANFDRLFSVAIVVSLLTGFHMFAHDISPLLLAMFLVMPKISQHESTALRILLWSTLVLFWIPPTYFILVAQHSLYLFCPIMMIFGCATLALSQRRQQVELPSQAIGETCSSA